MKPFFSSDIRFNFFVLKSLAFMFLSFSPVIAKLSAQPTEPSEGAETVNESVLGLEQVRELSQKYVLRLSRGQPSASGSFEFQLSIGVDDPDLTDAGSQFQFAPTVQELVAGNGRAFILIRSTDGLPYMAIADDLIIVQDEHNPGGLVYYQGARFYWELVQGRNRNRVSYRFSAGPEVLESEIDLNVGGILIAAVADGLDVLYDEGERTVSFTWDNRNFEATLATEESSFPFGIEKVELHGDSIPDFLITDIKTQSQLVRNPPAISVEDLNESGFQLREIDHEELKELQLTVPKGFPATEEMKSTAEKFVGWLNDKMNVSFFEKTKTLAESGIASAQFNLSVLYFKGEGVRQNYENAFRWAQAAAEQEHIEAQSNLGIYYANGIGVEKNEEQAFLWTQKAAEQGHLQAAFNLATAYFQGRGVMKNIPEAITWYESAAEQGHLEAQKLLIGLYRKGEEVEQSDEESARWVIEAARHGEAEVQYNLAFLYLEGKGVEQDIDKAIDWFRKSANQGYASAQLNLGVILYTRQEDSAEVYKWLFLAAEQGEQNAKDAIEQLFKDSNPEVIEEGKRLALSFKTRKSSP